MNSPRPPAIKVCAQHNRWVETNTPRGRVKRRCPECTHKGRKRALRIVERPARNYEE